ncbi:hypothetical protein J4214_01140 [Candidatus Woesearchaeota archaeon]|nr:hypothetical protein [Candidatus Woesearchaeota archaeon]
MKRENNIFVYIMVLFIIIAFVFVVYSGIKDYKYKKALNSEDPLDKCRVPSGYTTEEWIEHMSHHPDRYKECLKR